MSRPPTHDCPCCTCDQWKLEWSDREARVYIDDLEDVAGSVVSCALDHSYDRPRGGLPWGLPEEWRPLLAPVVEKHLTAMRPDWEEHTVYMEHAQRVAFLADVLDVLKAAPSPSGRGQAL